MDLLDATATKTQDVYYDKGKKRELGKKLIDDYYMPIFGMQIIAFEL